MIVHLVLIQKWHFLYLSWMSMNWKTENTCWTLMKRWLQKCRQMFWSIFFSGLFLWKFDVLHSKFPLKVTFLSQMSFDFCDISNLCRKFRPRSVAPVEISGALFLGLTRFWSTVYKAYWFGIKPNHLPQCQWPPQKIRHKFWIFWS